MSVEDLKKELKDFGRLDALQYVDDLIENYFTLYGNPAMPLHPAALAILEDLLVPVRAAAARLRNGGKMRSLTPLCTDS